MIVWGQLKLASALRSQYVEVAMSTIDTLEAEAEKHRLIVKKIESLIRDLREIGRPQDELPLPRMKSPNGSESPAVAISGLIGLKQIAAIEAIIKSKGQATAREIFNTLNANGFSVKKMAYVSSILSRNDKGRFERIGEGKQSKWRIALPQAG